jgi:hypothetical protein
MSTEDDTTDASLWSRLPGENRMKVAFLAFVGGVLIALFIGFVVPALGGTPPSPTLDGGGGEQDDVVEPDGVRSSPTFPASENVPTPVVPEDVAPQQ